MPQNLTAAKKESAYVLDRTLNDRGFAHFYFRDDADARLAELIREEKTGLASLG